MAKVKLHAASIFSMVLAALLVASGFNKARSSPEQKVIYVVQLLLPQWWMVTEGVLELLTALLLVGYVDFGVPLLFLLAGASAMARFVRLKSWQGTIPALVMVVAGVVVSVTTPLLDGAEHVTLTLGFGLAAFLLGCCIPPALWKGNGLKFSFIGTFKAALGLQPPKKRQE